MIDPVVDNASHHRALRRIELLWDARAGSSRSRELDAIATLVDAYERRVHSIPDLDPIAAITTRCAELGWSRRRLEPLIGSRGRVSEVLAGRRPLTLAMIRRIHSSMQLPAEILIAERTARGKTRRASRSTATSSDRRAMRRAA